MMRIFSVVVIFSIYGFIGIKGLEYQLIETRKNWLDADKDCRSRDGHLLTLDSKDSVREFESHMNITHLKSVWTSGYRMHSPWIWMEGCFSAGRLDFLKGQRIIHNHASTCSKHCQNTQYAGLWGDRCFCLEDIREFEPLNAQACSVMCPWSSGDYCGGKDAISLYSLGGVDGQKDAEWDSLSEPKHAESRQDWKNCVYLLKHREATWITADCRKKLPFLCKIYREQGTITEYRSPTINTASWTEARDICRQEGGTLADLHASNMETIAALPIESEYWVGLFRNTSWTWHIELTEEHPQWCTSVSAGKSDISKHNTDACSLPLPYVCQYGSAPSAEAIVQKGNMTAYVAVGTVAWVLAILTVVMIIYLLKKRGWRLRSRDIENSPISTRYTDLDEESNPAPRTLTGQPAYVNSEASGQCRPAPSESSTLKSGNSKYQNVNPANTCNAYATVNMSHTKSAKRSADLSETSDDGACRLPSTSSDGEYDLVWDSVNMKKQVGGKSTPNTSTSTPVENIYTEVFKIAPKTGE